MSKSSRLAEFSKNNKVQNTDDRSEIMEDNAFIDEPDSETTDASVEKVTDNKTKKQKGNSKVTAIEKDSSNSNKINELKIKAELAKLPPALQKECEFVQNWLNKMSEYAIRQLWTLGERLREIYLDTSGKYGQNPLDAMSRILDIHDKGRLYKLMHFYVDFPKALLEWMLSKKMKTSGKTITWSHIVALMPAESEEERREFLELTFENDWSPAELAEALRKKHNRLPGPGGRPIKIPATFEGKLENMMKMAQLFLRNESMIWNHQTHGIVASAKQLTGKKSIKEVMQSLEEARDLLVAVEDGIQRQLTALEDAEEILKQKLSEKSLKPQNKS